MTMRYIALCAAASLAVVAVQATTAFAQAPAPAAPAATPASPPKPSPAAAPAAAGSAIFPSSVDPKYAKETAGRARRNTCLDQYRANKKTNANGGLKWLAHNGYWSQCDKKLKGS